MTLLDWENLWNNKHVVQLFSSGDAFSAKEIESDGFLRVQNNFVIIIVTCI